MEHPGDLALFEKIKNGDGKAFREIFERYYPPLCCFALQLLGEDEAAEEIVQNMFVKLWEKRGAISIDTSVRQYLFRSVKNYCINHIQHNKIKKLYAEKAAELARQEINSSDYYLEIGLAEKIEACVESLPEKRQEIFRLSREDGLKYKEIADRLNISVKTVETQMGFALKTLRENLKEFIPGLMLFNLFFAHK